MSKTDFILTCSISPPAAVIIGEKTPENEFIINFKKVPVKIPEDAKLTTRQVISDDPDLDPPLIHVCCGFGTKEGDLCTLQEASTMQFTTVTGDGWTMRWSQSAKCFIVRLPANFTFPDDYEASFRSNGFLTSANTGTATLICYLSNFPDVMTDIVSVGVYKRYPVEIKSFDINPKTDAELGKDVVLTWQVYGADNCNISGIGEVPVEGSRTVETTGPTIFTLTAENNLGRSKYSEQQIRLKKPSITIFDANPKYYYEGEQVKLNWEVVSASEVVITPEPGQVDREKGEVFVKPTGLDTTYTMTASGYDGINKSSAVMPIDVRVTPWKCEGVATGLSTEIEELNGGRQCWSYKGKQYLFGNGALYESSGGLVWSKLSTPDIPADMSLSKLTTSIFDDKFFVIGATKADSDFICAFYYDFASGKWTNNEIIRYTQNLDGIAGVAQDRHLYAKLSGSTVLFYERLPKMEKWGNTMYLNTGGEADAMDFIGQNDYFWIAVRSKASRLISFFNIHKDEKNWHRKDTLQKEIEGWFRLAVFKNKVYLLYKDNMIDVDSFKEVSKNFPAFDGDYAPWRGAGIEKPFFILKNGVVWSYKP